MYILYNLNSKNSKKNIQRKEEMEIQKMLMVGSIGDSCVDDVFPDKGFISK